MFQSTRPQGARLISRWCGGYYATVSIHAPAGGATQRLGRLAYPSGAVSIHAPAGGATYDDLKKGWYWYVSIHAPAGGATYDDLKKGWYWYVSIHAPAGGATLIVLDIEVDMFVSIHAPAGGATLFGTQNPSMTLVSIHAPAGGATKRPFAKNFGYLGFNPRARRGRDRVIKNILDKWDTFQSTRPQGARQGH